MNQRWYTKQIRQKITKISLLTDSKPPNDLVVLLRKRENRIQSETKKNQGNTVVDLGITNVKF